MKYRAEIDGLRAVAILPVLLNHANFELFSGGFVGVDIFFVISGYLITMIILSEMEQNRFSIVHFYERRARRILPALFLVMFVSILMGLPLGLYSIVLPNDILDFAQSVAATSLFSSNFLFWMEAGYWDTSSEYKPLLHTWSLAIEEQYYVLVPIFLTLMWRFDRRHIFGSFIVIAFISLLIAEWELQHDPTAAYYLLHARAWELALGAFIAFIALYRNSLILRVSTHRTYSELLSILGLALILYAIFVFDSMTPFPGLDALVPTVGAALIIAFSTPKTIVGQLLGSKLFVGIGLISYSLYLWHQPLYAYARHYSLTEVTPLQYSLLIGLSFILAYGTWRFIENPFRKKRRV